MHAIAFTKVKQQLLGYSQKKITEIAQEKSPYSNQAQRGGNNYV